MLRGQVLVRCAIAFNAGHTEQNEEKSGEVFAPTLVLVAATGMRMSGMQGLKSSEISCDRGEIRSDRIQGRKDVHRRETGQAIRFRTFGHSLTSWLVANHENRPIVRAMLRWTKLNMLSHCTQDLKANKIEAQGAVLEKLV